MEMTKFLTLTFFLNLVCNTFGQQAATQDYYSTDLGRGKVLAVQLPVMVVSRDVLGRQRPTLEAFSYGQIQSILASKSVKHGIEYASTITEGKSSNGRSKFTYYQTYLDTTLEVFGGQLLVFAMNSNDGNVTIEVADNLYDMKKTVNLTPLVTSEQAFEKARSDCTKCTDNKPNATRLGVFPVGYSRSFTSYKGDGNLAWRVPLRQSTDAIIYYIDARTGAILFIQDETRKYTAQTLYSGAKDIPSYWVTSQFYLEDNSKGTSVVSCASGNCSVLNQLTDADGTWDNTQDNKIATEVMYGVTQTLSYLYTAFGRNGIDGYGGPNNILSVDGTSQRFAHKIHAGTNQVFAQWSSNGITYGDGDGTTYGTMVSTDIIAHEIGHGVLQYTANLNGAGEPGALEESFGDILAALVDRNIYGERAETWKFGEDVYTPGTAGDAIRYLDNPHSATNNGMTTDDDPDHYSEMYTGLLDNGGVHTNAGIPNKAFYLLAKGGVHHMNPTIQMSGIGIDAAAAIWWRAYTFYSTSSTTFADFRDNMERSARDLYGTTENFQVGVAWGLCGVGSVPSPMTSQRVSNPDLEGSTGWTVTQQTGTAVTWVQRTSDAHSGVKYFKFGGVNSVAGTASIPFSINATATSAILSYWAWVTGTDSLTVANDKLFFELYTNDISNSLIDRVDTISNRNSSSTFFQRTVDLLPYKSYGSMKLVLRVSTDFNLPTTFKVDDIQINTNVY